MDGSPPSCRHGLCSLIPVRVLVADPLAADALAAGYLQQGIRNVDVLVWPDCGPQAAVDLLITWEIPPELALPSGLKAILCYGAGAERILADPRVPADVPVLRLVDAGQAERMLDHALAAAYEHLVRLGDYRALQSKGRWTEPPLPVRAPAGLRITVLGLGAIGSFVAEGLAQHGFDVVGWASSRRPLEGVTVLAGPDGLRAALAGADVLLNVLPAAPELVGILDAGALARLAPGGMLANFGRGEHVDLAALRIALDGPLGSAWLDVFPEEPLPSDHWAWTHPKVTITPHVAGIPIPERGAGAVGRVLVALRDGLPLPGVLRAGKREDA